MEGVVGLRKSILFHLALARCVNKKQNIDSGKQAGPKNSPAITQIVYLSICGFFTRHDFTWSSC